MPPERFDVVGWAPVGQLPYRDFLATRVFDSWAHEQDVRRAAGPPRAAATGPGSQAVLDRCDATMPFVVGKRVAPPDGTTVRFVVTGVLGRQVTVAVSDGRAVAVPVDSARRPPRPLSIDQETFWRLGFGRIEPTRPWPPARPGWPATSHSVTGCSSRWPS